jgi:hypothetical protein
MYKIVSPRVGTPGDEFVPVAGVNLDALIAGRYFRLKRIDMEHILGVHSDPGAHVFKRLEKKETSLYGEFLSRRLILEAWDRLFGA